MCGRTLLSDAVAFVLISNTKIKINTVGQECPTHTGLTASQNFQHAMAVVGNARGLWLQR